MEDIPTAFASLFANAHKKGEAKPNGPQQTDLGFDTPIFGGIMGAAQLSTAMLLWSPSSATDIGLSGAGGAYLLWTIPLGSLLGVLVARLLLRLPRRFHTRSGVRRNWIYAAVLSIFIAPMAPGFLGLAPQSQAQLWRGFAAISAIVWLCIIAMTQLERRRARYWLP